MKDAVNGYGFIFRFITPLLLALLIYMFKGVEAEVKAITLALNNHIQHDVVEIKVNIAKITQRLDDMDD